MLPFCNIFLQTFFVIYLPPKKNFQKNAFLGPYSGVTPEGHKNISDRIHSDWFGMIRNGSKTDFEI